MGYIEQAQKWKLQSHGLWTEPKPEIKESIKDFKKRNLILTKEKLAEINGR